MLTVGTVSVVAASLGAAHFSGASFLLGACLVYLVFWRRITRNQGDDVARLTGQLADAESIGAELRATVMRLTRERAEVDRQLDALRADAVTRNEMYLDGLRLSNRLEAYRQGAVSRRGVV